MKRFLVLTILMLGILALTPTNAHAQTSVCGVGLTGETGPTETAIIQCGTGIWGNLPGSTSWRVSTAWAWGWEGWYQTGGNYMDVWCPFDAVVSVFVAPDYAIIQVYYINPETNEIDQYPMAFRYTRWDWWGDVIEDYGNQSGNQFCNFGGF